MALLAWVQAEAAGAVTLNTIIDAFAGLAILYVLKVVMATKDKTEKIGIALYGDPDSKEPNGVVRDIKRMTTASEAHSAAFAAHVADENLWRTEARDIAIRRNNDLQGTLSGIGMRLDEIEARAKKRGRGL